jgi:ABC-type sugar transport system ATPase subunit
VISSDLDELRALCDRVIVLFRGKLVSESKVADASDERLAAAMAGIT